MASTAAKDSPLSITSSIAGILTFVVAILATIYVRINYLRNADDEYFSVKTSLSWYKTESTFLRDLIRSAEAPAQNGRGEARMEMEMEMYGFVMEQLGKLEERLLELLTEAEESAERGVERDGMGGSWTILPGRTTGIALSWLGVRTKALDLVKQREALGNRVLFAQMSMISSRVRDQEMKSRKREEQHRGRLERLEKMLLVQDEKLDKLENMMYGSRHRDRPGLEDGLEESLGDQEYEDHFDVNHRQKPWESLTAVPANNVQRVPGPDQTKPYYSISSV